MSSTEVRSNETNDPIVERADMKLETIVIPVSDVDRAKAFYEGLGWRLDADIAGGALRLVQLTPPGSGCSIQFGTGLTSAAPGTAECLLVVSDIEAAHDELVGDGVDANVFHDAKSVYNRFDPDVRESGPDPQRRTYASFAEFSDPDGNVWQLQEITSRLPGRVDPSTTTYSSVGGRRGRAPARGGRPRRARGPDRPGRRELARLVRRLHGRRAVRRRAASVTDGVAPGEPELAGQTVVVIGGTSGIGLETARLARRAGADVIVTARDPDRLQRVGDELGARTAAFDATDFGRLGTFFDDLPTEVDHVLVTGPGPYYAPLSDFDLDAARRDVESHLLLPIQVARNAAGKVRAGRDPAVHGRHRWPPHGGGIRVHLGADGCAPRPDEGPRARARARPREPHRGRFRRHAVVGDAPGR